MQKWEYLVLWFTKDNLPDVIQGIFSSWGMQGWELVAVCGRPGHPDTNQAFFKRAVDATTILS